MVNIEFGVGKRVAKYLQAVKKSEWENTPICV